MPRGPPPRQRTFVHSPPRRRLLLLTHDTTYGTMSLSVGSPAADILLTYWSMNMNMKAKQNKLSVAIERAIRAENFYVVGESLGFEEIVTAEYWVGALKSLKKPADRVAMRAGFVAAYRCAHKSEAAAQKRFSRLAAMYSPQTSRKAKS